MFDLSRINRGSQVSKAYIQSIIQERSAEFQDELVEFKRVKGLVEKYKGAKGTLDACQKEHRSKKTGIRKELRAVQASLVPEISVLRKRRRDLTLKETFADMYDRVPYEEFELYLYQQFQHDLISQKEYGLQMSYLKMEQDLVESVLDDDIRVVCRMRQSGIFNSGYSPFARYPWHRVYESIGPVVRKYVKQADCPKCGETRDTGAWIASHTCHCPCGYVPGLVFYCTTLRCKMAEAKKYAASAWALYTPPETDTDVQNYKKARALMLELDRCDDEFADASKKIKAEMLALRHEIDDSRDAYFQPRTASSYRDRPFFEIIRCTQGNCCGLVDVSAGAACAICETPHCATCWTVHEGECSETDVDAVQTMKETSKQCPNCRTIIQRSMGCSTMYCTRCRRGFNYNTGEMIGGIVENPHYWETLNVQKYKTMWDTQPLSWEVMQNFEAKVGKHLYRLQSKTRKVRALVRDSMGLILRDVLTTYYAQSYTSCLNRARVVMFERFLHAMEDPSRDCFQLHDVVFIIHKVESYVAQCTRLIREYDSILLQHKKDDEAGELASSLTKLIESAKKTISDFGYQDSTPLQKLHDIKDYALISVT